MRRESVYIETSIVSYLAARRSRNLIAAACQQITWEFWEVHRSRYDLYTSELVVEEASMGNADVSERRLGFLRGIPELPVEETAKALAAEMLSRGAIPPRAEFDALHIAVSAVNGVDYLVTWNCRHLDNPAIKPRVREVCRDLGWPCPEICTPLELVEEQPDEG